MNSPAPEPLLAARGIAKAYGPVVALRSADFTVGPGEIHALLGANGAGKSTLVKVLSGVITADTGEVRVGGVARRLRTPADATRAGIATVFQDPALLPDLTVAENVRLSNVDRTAWERWSDHLGLADVDPHALIRELPLETLRMLDLARAVARDPQVLLLDELTAALPADQAERVFGLLDEWIAGGRSAVLITHRLAEVMRVCHRATILRDGRDVERLSPKEVDEQQLIAAMLGAPLDEVAAAAGRTVVTASEAPIALAAEHLASTKGVHDVSFSIRKGEIVGVVALDGQGQDRLFDLLAGDRRPTAGQISIGGRPVTMRSPADAVRHGVVLVPGDRVLALLPNQSVQHNLATPLFNRLARWLRIPGDEGAKVAGAIDDLSVDTRAASQVRRLSGGNQQKVAIGRWLVGGFTTLLCFDPTRGIDLQTKREIYVLLRRLADEGASILLYTSELPEIALVCDRVLVLHDGRIVDEQDAATATEQSMLSSMHGLVGADAGGGD